jgi:hypothetical protein
MKVTRKTACRTRRRTLELTSVAACVLAALAGCSPPSQLTAWIPWLSHGQRSSHIAAQHPVPPPKDASMVRAVGDSSGGGVPVEVRFALRARPEIGEQAKLDLEMVPTAPLDRLVASFHAEPGLTVAQGAKPAEVNRPDPGVPIHHELTIVAQRDGIFYVSATVLADSSTGSVARTFTIPIIAGGGVQ